MSSRQKTIVITGGGRGLGQFTAQRLAELGHRVLFTARTQASAMATLEAVRAKVPEAQLEGRVLDLGSLTAIREVGSQLEGELGHLDVLLNCAGVMQQSPVRRLTADGFEETLAVNALAPFALTHALLPALRRSPEARVVNVSSRLHLPGSRGAPVDFDFDDPDLARGYHPDRAYKNSKLALLWFTYELQRRLGAGPLKVNAVCPGFVPRTAAASVHGFQHFLLEHVLPHLSFATSVEDAVGSLVFMAADPSLDEVRGHFYGEKKSIDSSPESLDLEKARRFWQLAAAATVSGEWP